MKLGYIILYVENVLQTVEFYEHAFGLQRRMVTEENQYAELETGATRLTFAANDFVKNLTTVPFDAAAPDKPAPPIEIALVTEDVEPVFKKAISAGAVEVKKPERKPWGQLVGYVRDNNGFLVEICSPLP